MSKMPQEKLIVILGPTAVGKTALSIELAQIFNTEIISGDSMLMYRGFDIGSAKPTLAERKGIIHHLIDSHEPTASFNVADFVKAARPLITKINSEGKIPIIAGGTGLYIKALLEGYEFSKSGENSTYRQELEKIAKEKGGGYLYKMLKEAAPAVAKNIHPNNVLRVIRALEVAQSGEELSAVRAPKLIYDAYVIGLNRERSSLYERINKRVELMLSDGLISEVKNLLAAGVRSDAPAMKGIGYKEIVQLINGKLTESAVLDLVQKNTRHFAKRQLTWFRKMPYIHWYMADEMTSEELISRVTADVKKYFAVSNSSH